MLFKKKETLHENSLSLCTENNKKVDMVCAERITYLMSRSK